MKATMDIPDQLYRQVKARSALEGRSIREVAILLLHGWLNDEGLASAAKMRDSSTSANTNRPWLGVLRKYARNANGNHDMESIRASVAKGRRRDRA